MNVGCHEGRIQDDRNIDSCRYCFGSAAGKVLLGTHQYLGSRWSTLLAHDNPSYQCSFCNFYKKPHPDLPSYRPSLTHLDNCAGQSQVASLGHIHTQSPLLCSHKAPRRNHSGTHQYLQKRDFCGSANMKAEETSCTKRQKWRQFQD